MHVGNSKTNMPAYLKKKGTTSVAGLGEAQSCRIFPVNLFIDTKKLLKTRNVFYDPEGIGGDQEYLKTFIVFGGIPVQCIADFSIENNTLDELQLEFEKSEGIYRNGDMVFYEGLFRPSQE